jgi:hypothetical protein
MVYGTVTPRISEPYVVYVYAIYACRRQLCWALDSLRVRGDIRFEANISEYEANIFRFEANKTGFICSFRIEANQRILYAKRLKTEAKIPC